MVVCRAISASVQTETRVLARLLEPWGAGQWWEDRDSGRPHRALGSGSCKSSCALTGEISLGLVGGAGLSSLASGSGGSKLLLLVGHEAEPVK